MKFRPLFRKLKTELLSLSRRALVGTFAFVTAFAVVYGTAAHVIPFITSHPYFRLRTVTVACDTKAASPQSLAHRAGLHDRATLWDVDVAQAEAALESTAWVRDAVVVRRFPDHVTLRVRGRTPVAATLTEDGPFLIDADGVLFREAGAEGYPDIPYLIGWRTASTHGERAARLRTLMAVLDEARDGGRAVSEISMDEAGAVTFYPETPRIAVQLGRDPDPAEVLGRLDIALASLDHLIDSVRAVDVTAVDRIVVKAAEGGLAALLTAKVGTPAVSDLAVGTPIQRSPDRG